MDKKTAIIIGAGPAGLTAAYELSKKTDINIVVLEAENCIGGISKTIDYKANKIDIGPHRFFSKSDRVMKTWLELLPFQSAPAKDDILLNREINFDAYKYLNLPSSNANPQNTDNCMLERKRLTRIFFLQKFFDYPVSLNFNTIKNLGLARIFKSGFSYLHSVFFKRDEKSLEDFMINRFGKELYLTFFKDYTYKVWGVKPSQIPADWGVQRIKGISIKKVLWQSLKKIFAINNNSKKKNVEVSLVESFLYPKLGCGQIWQKMADKITGEGVHLNQEVFKVETLDKKITAVFARDKDNNIVKYSGDYFISTMPIKNLIESFDKKSEQVLEVARGLIYRDFMIAGILVKNLEISNNSKFASYKNRIPDEWIYIQDREVRAGRMEIFNNWSPYIIKDYENTMWLGVEYFCNKGDELWSMKDEDFLDFAVKELEKINILKSENVLDKCLIKVEKAYPAYFGTYDKFETVKNFTDKFEN
ncbi:MAG: FAD-dependent oxidoreductase, partial [Elusimicrobiota bacterium]|nr:FAD-dependent oxidoreductase [Elusimicrobiota bacterium]